jgi:hypothetical protein
VGTIFEAIGQAAQGNFKVLEDLDLGVKVAWIGALAALYESRRGLVQARDVVRLNYAAIPRKPTDYTKCAKPFKNTNLPAEKLQPCKGFALDEKYGKKGKQTCDQDWSGENVVCVPLLDTSGSPLSYGAEGNYWDIQDGMATFTQEDITSNQGNSWCVSVWGFGRLVKTVGCQNVQLNCDSTDIGHVLRRYSVGLAATNFKSAKECIFQKCETNRDIMDIFVNRERANRTMAEVLKGVEADAEALKFIESPSEGQHSVLALAGAGAAVGALVAHAVVARRRRVNLVASAVPFIA